MGLFGLTKKDVDTLKAVVRWWRGGGPGKSSRAVPYARRHLNPPGKGGEVNANFGFAVTTSEIPPMIHGITIATAGNDVPVGTIGLGEGTGYELSPTVESEYDTQWVNPTGSEEVPLYNMTTGTVKRNAVVQFKQFGDYRIIDAEDCG